MMGVIADTPPEVSACLICGNMLGHPERKAGANVHTTCWLESDDDVAYGEFGDTVMMIPGSRRSVWFYDKGSWDWTTAKHNRVNFPEFKRHRIWRENWFWYVGVDEFNRRTLVVHIPFNRAVVFAISRSHPEWEHEDEQAA
jgi:hypothetical protein